MATEEGMTKSEVQRQIDVEDELQISQNLLLLCFICDVQTCKLGLVSNELNRLAAQISESLQAFTLKLYVNEESNAISQEEKGNNTGYDPMKDPNKVNVVY